MWPYELLTILFEPDVSAHQPWYIVESLSAHSHISQEYGAVADGFGTKILLGEEISSTEENDDDGGVFSAELKPPKSITSES